MKIFRSSQIREIDHFTIQNEPIESIDLMERAASAITKWIIQNINKDKAFKVFVGPGNNGGDALVVARQLAQQNYKTEVFMVRISEKLSPDCEINLNRLKKETSIKLNEIKSKNDLPKISSDTIIIDGIFGSGLTRKTDGLAKETIIYLNNSKATIISIDILSGLFGEDNSTNDSESIIKANYTLTVQFP